MGQRVLRVSSMEHFQPCLRGCANSKPTQPYLPTPWGGASPDSRSHREGWEAFGTLETFRLGWEAGRERSKQPHSMWGAGSMGWTLILRTGSWGYFSCHSQLLHLQQKLETCVGAPSGRGVGTQSKKPNPHYQVHNLHSG